MHTGQLDSPPTTIKSYELWATRVWSVSSAADDHSSKHRRLKDRRGGGDIVRARGTSGGTTV